MIYPFYEINIKSEELINENIFDLNYMSNTNNNEKQNNEKFFNSIALLKNIDNDFNLNNPYIPEEITCLKINEEHNVLIASSIKNLIYIISINNTFKLMHIIDFFYEFPKKIKDIIPLSFYGDFLIYTSLNVYLFSINGVPLCELNLLKKEYNELTKIKYVTGYFIYDVILFTAHEDGSINIWKVKNRSTIENYNERISYIYNNNNTKSFLSEYNYAYNLYYYENENNGNNYFYDNKIINEYELQRKFDLVVRIKITEEPMNPIIFMKMSRNINYMLVLDKKMNIYILSDFDDYNIDSSEKRLLIYKKDKKNCCIWCKGSIKTDSFRATYISSITNSEINDLFDGIENNKVNNRNNTENDLDSNNNTKKKEGTYLCEECKQKLTHTENYLYNY